MEELPLLGTNRDAKLKQILAMGELPAFLRRAARATHAWQDLLDSCRWKRNKELEFVRLRLGQLRMLAGEWSALSAWLSSEELEQLANLHDELQPALRVPVDATSSRRLLRKALEELIDCIERFNSRWRVHLSKISLKEINELRDKYNRYYLLEKECIVGSPALARRGFEPLSPLTDTDLVEALPLLFVPVIKD